MDDGGANASQYLQQQVGQAQGQMDQLKSKLDRLNMNGGGNSNMAMPDFTPNNQKQKSLFKRLEYGFASFHCSASNTIHIQFLPLPVFTLGNDTSLCTGQTLLLQPALLPHAGYLWSTGSHTASLNINSAGLYWLQVSNNGCMRTDSITIGYKPVPVINLGNDTTLCDGQTLLLDATNSNSSYSWQDGSIQPDYTVHGGGNYSVKVTENGCAITGSIIVSYITKPAPNITKDTTICVTQQLILDASYPRSTFIWQDGSSQPQFTVTREGVYSVSVTNSCGTSNDSVSVNYEDCACKFYVPQAFTPNNDGKNDLFMPKYQCVYSNYELRIFNRWGQAVFASKNPALGWDGAMGGKPQPAGTYVWEMAYKDQLTGKVTNKTGTVILIR